MNPIDPQDDLELTKWLLEMKANLTVASQMAREGRLIALGNSLANIHHASRLAEQKVNDIIYGRNKKKNKHDPNKETS